MTATPLITQLGVADLATQLRARQLSCAEVAQAHLREIEGRDPEIGAFLTVSEERARADAENAQRMLDAGVGGPLTGVPYALKDNISTDGIETTCASKILEGYIPPYSATVVDKLAAAGAVLLGKTNLDEFAMGASTETSAYHPTRNPWDVGRSPGGSSGGSAAAVAAEFVPFALGSDTGGSIRQPAALCGVVGFKPTYGRCSRYGLIAFGSSLDQIGPIARSVEDAALVSAAITGHDPFDATSIPDSQIRIAELKALSLNGLRIALPREMFGPATDAAVSSELERAISTLQCEGVQFEKVSVPSIQLGVSTYYIIAPAEASSNLARFDGVRFGPRFEGTGHVGMVEATRAKGFGREVKTRIMIGTYALSAGYYDAFYVKAQQVRSMMRKEFEDVFREFDAVLTPTSPVPAFRLGDLDQDPLAMKLLDFCTIPANMGGFPAISLNCGFAGGLPVGLQLMAPNMGDERLLQIAYAVEQALPPATFPSRGA